MNLDHHFAPLLDVFPGSAEGERGGGGSERGARGGERGREGGPNEWLWGGPNEASPKQLDSRGQRRRAKSSCGRRRGVEVLRLPFWYADLIIRTEGVGTLGRGANVNPTPGVKCRVV